MQWSNNYSPRNHHSSQDSDDNSMWRKGFHTAQALQSVGTALLLARGKLRPLDFIGIGLSSIQAGAQIWSIWSKKEEPNFSAYFSEKGDWKLCSRYVTNYALEGRPIQERQVPDYQIVRSGKIVSAIWTATVDGVEIGWVGPPGQSEVPHEIWSRTPDALRTLAAQRLWEHSGSDHIIRIQGRNTHPHYLPTHIIETEFLRTVTARAQAFLHKGTPRAFLLDGQPGCGKTSAVGYLAKKLGFKTVVINAEDLLDNGHSSSETTGIELAEMLRPDVLICNDVDRLDNDDQLKLLDIFDNAKGFAKLIFATTNHYRHLIEPVRRPGRLDDLIHVPGLSLAEIKHIAPDLSNVAERMLDWPIAYVRDMQERYDVLGPVAINELEEVAQRLAEVREDGCYRKPPEEANHTQRRLFDMIKKNGLYDK